MDFKFRTLKGVTFDLPDLFFRFTGKSIAMLYAISLCYCIILFTEKERKRIRLLVTLNYCLRKQKILLRLYCHPAITVFGACVRIFQMQKENLSTARSQYF